MSLRKRSSSFRDAEDGSRPLKQLKITVFSSQKELDASVASTSKADSGAEESSSQTATALRSLLDLSEVEDEKLQARFDAIAESLIHHSRLRVVNGDKITKYQILEAEFYLRDSERHWDPFTHGEEEQKASGKW